MNSYVALFRGVNVGGRNILPMEDLKDLLRGLGCRDVRTYIQSGNAVFRHAEGAAPRLAERIREAVASSHGCEPQVLVLTTEMIEGAVRANPFPEGEAEPSKLHLFFLEAVPEAPNVEAIEEARSDSERFAVIGFVAYLHAPDGIGRSKLATKVERLLGVEGTARNWRSVVKILEMARELG